MIVVVGGIAGAGGVASVVRLVLVDSYATKPPHASVSSSILSLAIKTARDSPHKFVDFITVVYSWSG